LISELHELIPQCSYPTNTDKFVNWSINKLTKPKITSLIYLLR